MATNQFDAELKYILYRLVDNSIDLPDSIGVIAYQFIFENCSIEKLKIQLPIVESLVYLKNIVTRNQIQTVKDLQYYYEKKRAKLHEIARRLQPSIQESTVSINFEGRTYVLEMKSTMEESTKASPVFYANNEQALIAVEFDNISYRNTLEEERTFLSEVKGNQLKNQQNQANVLKSIINKVVSN